MILQGINDFFSFNTFDFMVMWHQIWLGITNITRQENLQPLHGLLFLSSSKGSFILHRQDSTYHDLCYAGCEVLVIFVTLANVLSIAIITILFIYLLCLYICLYILVFPQYILKLFQLIKSASN